MTTISNIDIKIKTGDLSSAIKLTRDLGSSAASTEKVLSNLASVDFNKIPIALKSISVALIDVRKNAIQAKNAINDLAAATKASSSAGSLLQSSARSSTTAINTQAVAVQRLIDNLRKLNAQANNTNMTPRSQSAPSSSNASSSLSSSASSSGNDASMAAMGFRALSGALGPVGIAAGVVVSALVSMIGPMREADKYSAMMARGFATIGVSGQEAQSTLVDVANRAGVAYGEIARAYLSYSVAANEAGTTNQQATRTFEAVTMAVNRTGGSSEQAQRALLALSQMMSKGTVSSEELKGQLGEALPGAVSAGARAMKMDVASFLKEVGDGKVVAKDFVDALTSELERANKATDGMSDNFSANMTKMGNSIGNMTLRLMTASAEATNTMFALQKMAAWMDKVDNGSEVHVSIRKAIEIGNDKSKPDEQQFRKAASDQYLNKMQTVGQGNGATAEAAKFFSDIMTKRGTGVTQMARDEDKMYGVSQQLKKYMEEGKTDQAKALTAIVNGYSGLMTKGLSGYNKDQTAKKEKQEVDDATNRIGRDKAIKDAGIIRRNNPIEKAQIALEDWDKATAALIKGKTGTELERIKAQRDAGRAELEVKKKNAEESVGKKSSRSTSTSSTAANQNRAENNYNNIKADIEQNNQTSGVGQNKESELSIAEQINASAQRNIALMRAQFNAGSLSLRQFREQYAIQSNIVATAEKEADIKVKYANAQEDYVQAQQKILDNTIQKINSDEKLKSLSAAQATELRKQAQSQYDTNIAKNKTVLADRQIAELSQLQNTRQQSVNKSLEDQEKRLEKIVAKHKEATNAAAERDKKINDKYREENDPDREIDPSGTKKRRRQHVEDATSNTRGAYENAVGAARVQQDIVDEKGDAASPDDIDKLKELQDEVQRAKKLMDDMTDSAGAAFDEIDAKQNSVAGGLKEGYNKYLESMPTFAERARTAIAGLSDAMAEYGNGIRAGENAIKQWGKTMLQQITAVIVKSLILAAIQTAMGGGSFGSNFSGHFKSGMGIKQAKGGAWSGGVQKFATGGTFTNSVVDKPTNFIHTGGMGLMGEAGPEAIMPLKRASDGSLGVRVMMPSVAPSIVAQSPNSGAAPVINISIVNQIEKGSAVGNDPSALSDMISQRVKTEVSTAMVQAQRPGGMMYGK